MEVMNAENAGAFFCPVLLSRKDVEAAAIASATNRKLFGKTGVRYAIHAMGTCVPLSTA